MNFFIKFIKFYRPLVFLLALAFWFNFLLLDVKAFEFGCLKTNGSCEKINMDSFSGVSEKCVADYGQGTRAILEGCNNYGCVRPNGVCRPITAVDGVEGRAKCEQLYEEGTEFSALACNKREQDWGCEKPDGTCVNIKDADPINAGRKCGADYGAGSVLHLLPCDVERPYACFKVNDKDCVVVEANTQYRASTICKERCAGTNLSCYVKFELSTCPDVPSDGTSLDDLQKSAYSTLNKANLNSPAALIKRIINLLMAFIGSITLVLYVFAGVLWLTASGASDRVDKAKKILVWTTLGVAVMLFSYMLVSFLFEIIPK